MEYFYSYIRITGTKKTHYFANAQSMREFILTVGKGTIFSIKGLGSLIVREIMYITYPDSTDEETSYTEYGLICNHIMSDIDSLEKNINPINTDDAWVDYALESLLGGA